ncbi:MAG: CocE/NonD family hydrolase [Dehalococcoidales bacterium]|nr:CocE/NonD family hydrolase [Dehalococcoidales bacterium]
MQSQQNSTTVYEMRPKETVYVPMRDGVKVAIDIFRPQAEGRFPALLAMSGYGKDLQSVPQIPQPHLLGSDQKIGSLVWDGTMEAGNTRQFVGRGYVHIIGDIRGCGDSEGEHSGAFDPKEAEDGYDLVEWIASQPWCDGNVGLVGISYYACIQIFIAAEQPPHLKAIFPWEVCYDLYRQWATDEGVINPMMYRLYGGRHMDPGPTHGSGYANRNCVPATFKKLSGDDLDKLWKERLADPDLMKYTIYWSCLRYPHKSPLFADFLFNPNDGPFYWERTPYNQLDKIKVPTYVGGPWIDLWAKGGWYIFNKLNVPKKLIMGPGDERPWYQTHDEVLKWFDYWLKGIDNGIMDEPPVRFYTTGIEKWRTAKELPLPGTRWNKLYLRTRGRLIEEAPIFNEGPDCFVQQPLDETNEISSIRYSTPAFNKEIEMTGPSAFYFYASIDQQDTNWRVKLCDVDESSGRRFVLTEDWLKASHRAIDQSRSESYWPWHDHTRNVPVEPGKVYEYVIGLAPKSHVFRTGHHLELQIASMDDTLGGLHVCSSKTTLHKVYHNPEYPSYLLLPVVEG